MFKRTVADFEQVTGLHVTTNHTGKMSDIYSISTSCLHNPYCLARMQHKEFICHECFAAATENRYSELTEHLINNTNILSGIIIPVELWPFFIANDIFRLESFGDLNNEIQQINYFNFCRANKEISVAQWSKNPFITAKVIKAGYEKPENLQYVYSIPRKNVIPDFDRIHAIWPFIDRIMVIVTADFAAAHNIVINCGARSCNRCRNCYKADGCKVVYELEKKGGQTKQQLIDKILYCGSYKTAKYIYRVIKTDLHTVICRIPKAEKNISDSAALLQYRYHTI